MPWSVHIGTNMMLANILFADQHGASKTYCLVYNSGIYPCAKTSANQAFLGIHARLGVYSGCNLAQHCLLVFPEDDIGPCMAQHP